MATPDIGTTISEGYSRGLDRLGSWFPSLAVVAVASGLVGAAIAQLQLALVPDAGDMLASAFGGGGSNFSAGDLRTIQLLSVLGSAIGLVLSYGAAVVFSGVLHRERHGQEADVPGPGAILPAVVAGFVSLMPRIGMLFGLFLLGQLVSAFNGVLGGLLTFAGFVVLVYLGVRWTYATVVAGAGEATGDAAFERSAEAVDGSWWGTFGTFIVVGLAVGLPVVIASLIVGGILPTAFLTAFGRNFVMTLLGTLLWAAVVESAWHQVEGASSGIDHDPYGAALQAPPAPAPQPGPGPGDTDPRGPFV
ncbi:MAG: hypothetical protein JWM98_1877 [Thermoleophilia bacterium]|nr:hypothetical protein [Thermoleophilia bacterium]